MEEGSLILKHFFDTILFGFSIFRQRKIALPCRACRGKGFYICKLCRGNAVIQWSPLSDPIAMNPCVCPTCEGNRLYFSPPLISPAAAC